ncbi:uncharacterized protein LOC133327557, partial [Musca vetustissima]|uniref:uncharacterized protein LOC133327557 n=1 Tax=Musca vetustissima TaxID=27455 RepID=UPI002AB7AD8D
MILWEILKSEDIKDACEFVQTTTSCNGVVSLINYLYLFECVLQWHTPWLSLTLAVTILLLYALSLYVNARYFLLPNSIALANYLHIPNYDFGCIVLGILFTLPYGLSMIYSCFEYNRSDSLLHAMTFGKIFTCWVIGLCLLSYRGGFRINATIFLRDMFFLTVAWLYLYAAVQNEMLNENQEEYLKSESMIDIHSHISMAHRKKPQMLKKVNFLSSSSESLESDCYPESLYNPVDLNVKPWQQFWNCINPIRALSSHSLPIKIVMSHFYVLLALVIPVVHNERPLNGWCKAIFGCSCLIFPLLLVTLDLDSYTLFSCFILGICALLLIIVLTHSQRIPTNHE